MRSSVRKIFQYGLVAGGVSLAGCVAVNNPPVTDIRRRFCVEAKDDGYHNLHMGQGTKWNHNWDKRDPKTLVKPLKDDATPEMIEEYNKKVEEMKPKSRRVIVMVRHGQYNLEGRVDEERCLTDLGKKQADLTGERLKLLYDKYCEKKQDENGNFVPPRIQIIKSTMKRATETGDIVHKHLPDIDIKPCDLIREGAPCPPDPETSNWVPMPWDFYQEGAQIEAGFRKYFHRADPEQAEDSVDILVCHGNVIRYFVCRALQINPEAWLRMAVHNGSITALVITPSGRVSLTQVGETGHFPPNMLTFN